MFQYTYQYQNLKFYFYEYEKNSLLMPLVCYNDSEQTKINLIVSETEKMINENKLNKHYHLNHQDFCDKLNYLIED